MNQRIQLDPSDLPDSPRLIRSTLLALATALVILVTVVLPAEYAIDPTGAGRLLGLTDMGEIKGQLAEEAEADAAMANAKPPEVAEARDARLETIEKQLQVIANSLVALEREQKAMREETRIAARKAERAVAQAMARIMPPAVQPAQPMPGQAAESPETAPPSRPRVETQAARPDTEPKPEPAPEPVQTAWKDEVTITLKPGQGVEFKLVMAAGAEAEFQWTANGGVLNFDTHGDGGGQSATYKKGRGVGADSGVLKAEFKGNHGWFWRNRMKQDVTLTLRTRGDYLELKRLV